ncbi:MAG: DsbA family protein [Deltaproteobacteria bacterium]|nr:DsbA family protein [Deltaproteobacteria bacterium]
MKTLLKTLLPAVLIVSVAACQNQAGGDKAASDGQAAKTDAKGSDTGAAPTLEMYVMSQCPYGVQVVNAVAPVKQQLGDALNLKIGYIGNGAAGNFQSLHGAAEVKGDIAQLCAAKQAPGKYLDLIVCQNKNPRAVDTNWKDCAGQAGMDAAALEACVNGDEGQQLLAASFAEAQQKGAQGSPTMFINGKPYDGGRKTRDFLKAACDATTGDQPEACKNIPVPPVVHAIFFSDKRCAECNIAPLEPRIKNELGGLQVQHLDYMSDEGKKLYQELRGLDPNFKVLPAILVDAEEVVKDTEGYTTLQSYMQPLGKWRTLRLDAKFDPTAEICDNGGIDDDADGKADCADEQCTDAKACRQAKPRTLDLFVMSQCPYGAQAMVAANEVVQHFGKDITLNVHFIGQMEGDTLTSMHGQAEVDEDLREICAAAKYPKNHQFAKYLACRSKDYRNPTWQPCAKEAGMDEKVIQKCFDGEGKELLKKSFAFAESLKIGASPTFLSNNRREFNAVDPASLQKQFCADNPDVKGCAEPIGAKQG